jgi:hypothetical protein
MRAGVRSAQLLGLMSLVVGVPTLAYAQARDPVVAEELFEKGREALRRGDYATGCPLFVESQRLEPSVGTLMNIADCDEHDGALAKAWEHWHETIDAMVHAGDERVGIARARAEALDRRVPRLTLHLSGDVHGAEVTRDDVSVGAASLDIPLPVDPGVHHVAVRAPGHENVTRDVDIHEGETLTVSLTPGPESAPPPVATNRVDGPGPSPESPNHPMNSQKAAGVVALGIGGASLVLAVVSGIVVVGQRDLVNHDCGADKGCSPTGFDAATTGKTWVIVNAVSWASTIAGVGTGLTLIVTSHGHKVATLAPSDRGAGLLLTGAFSRLFRDALLIRASSTTYPCRRSRPTWPPKRCSSNPRSSPSCSNRRGPTSGTRFRASPCRSRKPAGLPPLPKASPSRKSTSC